MTPGSNLVKKFTLLFLLLSHTLFAQTSIKKGQPFTLDLPGPALSETSAENPFTDYRLDVTFTKGQRSLIVPGYFAADGKAAESGAARQEVLWGALMAGAGGVEWYYGWVQPPHDLNAEDFRSRNNMYEQTDKALKFFRTMPLHEMTSSDGLTGATESYCLSKAGQTYAVYLKKGGSTTLDLKDAAGTFSVKWYHPVEGTWHGESTVKGGADVTLKSPAGVPSLDWAVVVEKK